MQGARDDIDSYYEDWRAVYEALGRRGIARLVDSSKTAGGRRRLDLHLNDPGLRPTAVVQLWRALPEVVVSTAHGNNVQLEFGDGDATARWVKPRTVVAWLRANRNAARSCRRAGSAGVKILRLPYPDLVASPDAAVSRLTGAETEEVRTLEDWDHAIAGNRFRRSGWSGEVKERRHDDARLNRMELAVLRAVSSAAKTVRWV